MAGRRFTVHWAHIDALTEFAPDLLVERALYVIYRYCYTCAGGIAAMDMMMGALIATEHGAAFARQVSDWFIHARLRMADEPQLERMEQRFDLHHSALEAAADLMASHFADPLSPHQLAALSGTSLRHPAPAVRRTTRRFGHDLLPRSPPVEGGRAFAAVGAFCAGHRLADGLHQRRAFRPVLPGEIRCFAPGEKARRLPGRMAGPTNRMRDKRIHS
jgi:hypothetical protein